MLNFVLLLLHCRLLATAAAVEVGESMMRVGGGAERLKQ